MSSDVEQFGMVGGELEVSITVNAIRSKKRKEKAESMGDARETEEDCELRQQWRMFLLIFLQFPLGDKIKKFGN